MRESHSIHGLQMSSPIICRMNIFVDPRMDLHSALIDSTDIAPLPLYLRVEDRNSMAHGIEVRLPFLDYRLVSFLFSQASDETKINSYWNKNLMREAMRNKIPENVRTRKDKMGFPIPAQNLGK